MSTVDTGSTQAATLGLLYRSHYDWLREWLARRLGNRETGADLAQDTFVRLLIKHREGRIVAAAGAAPKEHTRAYLTTIANGLLVDHLRRRKVERAYADAIALLPQDLVPSAEDAARLQEALVAIDRFLSTLTPKIRATFLLSRLDGYSYPSIAALLGVSLSSVEKYMATALRQLYLLRLPSD